MNRVTCRFFSSVCMETFFTVLVTRVCDRCGSLALYIMNDGLFASACSLMLTGS